MRMEGEAAFDGGLVLEVEVGEGVVATLVVGTYAVVLQSFCAVS